MSSEALVEITDLAFSYGARAVLRGVNLTIPRGSVVGIMGASGSGKTTLMRLIGGQLKPARGEVKVLGQVVHALSRGELFELWEAERLRQDGELGDLMIRSSVVETLGPRGHACTLA